MRFELPQLQYETMFDAYKKEFYQNGEFFIHGDGGCHQYSNYRQWLAYCNDMHLGVNIPKGLVPATTYFVIEENKIVGVLNIRHRLNDALLQSGGHIGYSVAVSKRRQGIATKMLQFALKQCRTFNIDQVLVTCNKENIASKRTIERCGGILENEITIDDKTILRFWIKGE